MRASSHRRGPKTTFTAPAAHASCVSGLAASQHGKASARAHSVTRRRRRRRHFEKARGGAGMAASHNITRLPPLCPRFVVWSNTRQLSQGWADFRVFRVPNGVLVFRDGRAPWFRPTWVSRAYFGMIYNFRRGLLRLESYVSSRQLGCPRALDLRRTVGSSPAVFGPG